MELTTIISDCLAEMLTFDISRARSRQFYRLDDQTSGEFVTFFTKKEENDKNNKIIYNKNDSVQKG
jgi:hypothetical protein